MEFITKHALRTLMKQGDPDALELLGFRPEPQVDVVELRTDTPVVTVGEAFIFTVTLRTARPEKLLLDYIVTFATDRDTPSEKVYRVKKLHLGADEVVTVTKKHPMKLMTTRRLHEGTHTVTLQINGQRRDSISFDLIAAAG